MHKKLESDLISIAHRILQLKNKEDITVLYKEAKEVYEKLAVLQYINTYVNTTPTNTQTKEEITATVFETSKNVVPKNISEVIETKDTFVPVFELEDTTIKNDVADVGNKKGSFEEEMEDAVASKKANEMFENATKKNPVIMNDFQIGLSDRITFVKHLFKNSQEDFNRVLSQLNSFKTEREARSFVLNRIKPEYDWTSKKEYEKQLLTIIEQQFS